jgi:hypothetical protein
VRRFAHSPVVTVAAADTAASALLEGSRRVDDVGRRRVRRASIDHAAGRIRLGGGGASGSDGEVALLGAQFGVTLDNQGNQVSRSVQESKVSADENGDARALAERAGHGVMCGLSICS